MEVVYVAMALLLAAAFPAITKSLKHLISQQTDHLDDLHLELLRSGISLDGVCLGKSTTIDYKGHHYYFFVLNPTEDAVSNSMIKTQGMWERNLNTMFQDIFIKAGRPLGAPVIDVGVNVGAFSLFASSMSCRVFGYEMQPFHANLVDMSLRLSGYRSRSHVKNGAVWYLSGKNFSFTPEKKNYGGTTLNKNETDGSFKIASIRIDEDLEHKTHEEFFFMKMDIEGSEPNALLGMNAIIRKGRVRHIVTEIREAAPVLKVLFAVGYTCRIFDDGPDCLWPTCMVPTYQRAEHMMKTRKRRQRDYYDFHCELNITSSSSFVSPYKPSKVYPNGTIVRFKDDYFTILHGGSSIKEVPKESITDIQAIPDISYDDIFAFDFVRE
jgi:FkbM family methyltransferase